MACDLSLQVGNFLVTFDGANPVSGNIVRWCWTIDQNDEGPALSHWDIQTCALLSLTQLRQFTISSEGTTVFTTTDPAVIEQYIEFDQGFTDGFPVYGMKTDVPPLDPEPEEGAPLTFCYDFDEGQVSLVEEPGFVAVKSGAGQAADAIVFGLCSPGCEQALPGRGIKV